MKTITFLYAKNIIRHKEHEFCQELDFVVRVINRAYDKQVFIQWADEAGVWDTLDAHFMSSSGNGTELWRTHTFFTAPGRHGLPGTVHLAVCCRMRGKEYWENNNGHNYRIDANCGILLTEEQQVLNIDYQAELVDEQKYYPVTVAVRQSLHPRSVYVRWTTNGWKTYHTTPCVFKRPHRKENSPIRTENPNRYGIGLWASHIPVHNIFGIEYAVACESRDRTLWDNNLGINYTARHRRFKIMTLNLHCYQEDRQDEKFSLIAQAVTDLDVDIVCMQEVGEPINGPEGGCSHLNAARIINDRLKQPYYIFCDWSHIGFDSYREGIAVLSRYPFLERDSGFVSSVTDPHTIHARKVCTVRVDIPYIGPVVIFCVHLSWWDDGFKEQFENLRAWASGKQNGNTAATLLCGDLNVATGSEGYRLVTRDFDDQFRAAVIHEGGEKDRRFGNDGRIDHIFMNKNGNLKPAAARVLFTDNDYGRVSDHFGYYLEFEPA